MLRKARRAGKIVNGKPSIHYSPLTIHLKRGFTLIEIVLSLFLILAIVVILFATSGTFIPSRTTSLQGIATKIATREIENLRKTNFAALPSCPSPGGCPIADTDLARLPSGEATRAIDDYQGSGQIKQVTVKITWIDKGAPKEIILETLISENGL